MKVLLLGATGNMGSRILPALLTHGHTVVAYVRSSKKLESLLPAAVFQKISNVQGDATDATAIKKAILATNCDAVATAAGLAAVMPWTSSDLPVIFKAVVEGTRQAGKERKAPLRAWFLGGMGVMYYPGTTTTLSSYLPMFLEHGQNLALLKSLQPNEIDWSMLCPANMTSESTSLEVPTAASQSKKLIPSTTTPPQWKHSWIGSIPVVGRFVEIMMNFGRYEVTLEQNAEFIASDFENRDSPYIGMPVGTIDASK